jgi:hypothetical protein
MALFAVALGGFWMAQAGIALLFQYGSTTPGRWLRGYVIGNIIGGGGTLLLLVLLRMGDANVATGLAVGGGFLAQQVALVLVYRGRLTPVQALGIAAIVGGMLCLGMGAKG